MKSIGRILNVKFWIFSFKDILLMVFASLGFFILFYFVDLKSTNITIDSLLLMTFWSIVLGVASVVLVLLNIYFDSKRQGAISALILFVGSFILSLITYYLFF